MNPTTMKIHPTCVLMQSNAHQVFLSSLTNLWLKLPVVSQICVSPLFLEGRNMVAGYSLSNNHFDSLSIPVLASAIVMKMRAMKSSIDRAPVNNLTIARFSFLSTSPLIDKRSMIHFCLNQQFFNCFHINSTLAFASIAHLP